VSHRYLTRALYADLDHAEEAAATICDCLALAGRISYPRGEVIGLTSQGWLHLIRGDFSAAIASYKQASNLAQDLGDKFTLSRALRGLACACHHSGQAALARKCCLEALALDIPTTNHACAVRLGLLCLFEGDKQMAAQHFSHGIALCQAQSAKADRFYDALYQLGLAQLAGGQPEEAISTYRRAMAICSARGVLKVTLADIRLLQGMSPPLPGVGDAAGLLETEVT